LSKFTNNILEKKTSGSSVFAATLGRHSLFERQDYDYIVFGDEFFDER